MKTEFKLGQYSSEFNSTVININQETLFLSWGQHIVTTVTWSNMSYTTIVENKISLLDMMMNQ